MLTYKDLVAHIKLDRCKKFTCRLCNKSDFTMRELREHLKEECGSVPVRCAACSQQTIRQNFDSHFCIRERYIK